MSAAAIVVKKQKDIVRAYERAQATDVSRAMAPESIDVRQSLVFKGLIRRGVLVPAGDSGKFYLDIERWAAFRKRRRALVMIFMTAVVIGGVVAFFVSRAH